MIDPHREKYFPFYWDVVLDCAAQSVATRHRVGALVVTPTGMLSPGWNGMPPGMPNECEHEDAFYDDDELLWRRKSRREVIHAERNAIDKMTRQGIAVGGSLLFVSRSPCFECAKALHGLGLKKIWFLEEHDDPDGIGFLRDCGVEIELYRGPRRRRQ